MHVLTNAESKFRDALSSQPYSTEEDMIATSAPFLIEHKISDDLRSWWIEERDKKAEMVYEEKDPGMAECERQCMPAWWIQ